MKAQMRTESKRYTVITCTTILRSRESVNERQRCSAVSRSLANVAPAHSPSPTPAGTKLNTP